MSFVEGVWFANVQGSRLCRMCPANMTNLEDGSPECNVPILPGTDLTMRYAVVVSFGITLNGTSLEEVATKVNFPHKPKSEKK